VVENYLDINDENMKGRNVEEGKLDKNRNYEKIG